MSYSGYQKAVLACIPKRTNKSQYQIICHSYPKQSDIEIYSFFLEEENPQCRKILDQLKIDNVYNIHFTTSISEDPNVIKYMILNVNELKE